MKWKLPSTAAYTYHWECFHLTHSVFPLDPCASLWAQLMGMAFQYLKFLQNPYSTSSLGMHLEILEHMILKIWKYLLFMTHYFTPMWWRHLSTLISGKYLSFSIPMQHQVIAIISQAPLSVCCTCLVSTLLHALKPCSNSIIDIISRFYAYNLLLFTYL